MLKQKEKIDKSTWLTTTGQRARYYIGDLARTCEGAIITTFMTMFLLMQGIHPGKMAAITLFVKIIDSFDDVIFGFLIDRIKIKGSGKYLPWFRKTFWLFPLFTVLFFMMPHATQCTVSESSRHRIATTGRENSFVQEVSSMKTCFTRSLFASKALLEKNASKNTFSTVRWISDDQMAD